VCVCDFVCTVAWLDYGTVPVIDGYLVVDKVSYINYGSVYVCVAALDGLQWIAINPTALMSPSADVLRACWRAGRNGWRAGRTPEINTRTAPVHQISLPRDFRFQFDCFLLDCFVSLLHVTFYSDE
jgi:hypothetical protein